MGYMTGLYFIRFSSQNVCFNNVYSLKNTNLNRTEIWKRQTVSSVPRVTDISVNHGSPTYYVLKLFFCFQMHHHNSSIYVYYTDSDVSANNTKNVYCHMFNLFSQSMVVDNDRNIKRSVDCQYGYRSII